MNATVSPSGVEGAKGSPRARASSAFCRLPPTRLAARRKKVIDGLRETGGAEQRQIADLMSQTLDV